jgi:hypothetical protein
MTWKRALLRLWIVISLVWVAGVSYTAYSHFSAVAAADKCFNERKERPAQETPNAFECFSNVGLVDDVLTEKFAKNYIALGVVPPIALLAAGILLTWIGRGFLRVRRS